MRQEAREILLLTLTECKDTKIVLVNFRITSGVLVISSTQKIEPDELMVSIINKNYDLVENIVV